MNPNFLKSHNLAYEAPLRLRRKIIDTIERNRKTGRKAKSQENANRSFISSVIGLPSSSTMKSSAEDPITVRWAHLALLVEFALELKNALQSINEQSFNHFVLKLGINHGPITAGVIGARKPHYDIWGNTVNVASRMESTGKAGCIQVTEETCEILKCFGYQFEQRGLVAVKGKGQLMTYYLLGKTGKITPTTVPVSPIMSLMTMETLNEEDESQDTSKSDDKTVIECIQNDETSCADMDSNV
ncbi:hypothetical protein WA026_023709 [Henosepilachna vigintioctopunctata]|uniref:adenylate cyclase n=1 Tax=Henosepilachna vigintioctopunctata TaxID=420089 RepID=A0AAW1UK86_9CUCU